MTTRMIDKAIVLETEVDLEDLADQIIERACGFQSPLTDADLQDFILHIVAEVNSEHLDKGLHEALSEFVQGHEHDA